MSRASMQQKPFARYLTEYCRTVPWKILTEEYSGVTTWFGSGEGEPRVREAQLTIKKKFSDFLSERLN